MDKKAVRTAVAIAAVFFLIGLIAAVKERSEDTAADGYLVREGPDGRVYEEELEITADGKRESVTVEVKPRSYTKEEAEKYLEEAAGRLEDLLAKSSETMRDSEGPAAYAAETAGDVNDSSAASSAAETAGDVNDSSTVSSATKTAGDVNDSPSPSSAAGTGSAPDTDPAESPERLIIMHDLALPLAFDDLPVTCDWLTDNSQVLSYSGEIGPEAEEAGTPAELQGVLTCGLYTKTVSFSLTVYPPDPAGRPFEERIAEAVAEANRGDADESSRWYLPSRVGDTEVAWRRNTARTGVTIGALGLITAALYLYAVQKRREQMRKRRLDGLMRDYPHIVSKLVLLLGAGLSMRRAFNVMTEDYYRMYRSDRQRRWGFEAVAEMCAEMDRGVLEADAYRQLGQKCELPAYRSFSVMLGQNLKRGSRELIDMLEREALGAFEERKKEARILGEQASAKLLAPMMLMLLIVFVIVMVPAFIAF